MSKITPSKNQQAIFGWVEHGEGSGIVDAVAGSGKTWTIVHACEFIPKDKKVLFLAFNKSIAVELGKKVPEHVEAKTLNALGHRAWYDHVGRVVVNDRKTNDICKDILYGHEKRLTAEIKKLVGLAKAFGIAPEISRGGRNPYKGLMGNSFRDYMNLVEHFDIDVKITDEDALVELTKLVLKKSAEDFKVIDYDDQLWLPVITDLNVQTYDWVIVDEAQDLSPVQRKLLHMSLKPEGRLLAVGDPYQAIYGFRGAASDSMDLLQSEFSCHRMPLSITYRCPKSVVRKAQEIVPHIEAADTAKEGLVEDISIDDYRYEVGDMVICRNAAPLVTLAYELLAKRIPVMMMGRDIGEGLVKLIDKMKPKGIDGPNGLLTKLEQWAAKEIAKAIKADRESRVQSIEDKHESILAFLKGCKAQTVPKLKQEINDLFNPKEGGKKVVLSTIHKAKGLEGERVFVYRPELMPSKYANLEWQMQQEFNLMYVAYTRALSELYLVFEELQDDREDTLPEGEHEAGQAAPTVVCTGAEDDVGADASTSGESRPCERKDVA
jgi:superfamily I DNA/RNA helicase